jgi:hypothetical protein
LIAYNAPCLDSGAKIQTPSDDAKNAESRGMALAAYKRVAGAISRLKGGKTIMRNRLMRSFVTLATSCLMLSLASPSVAQWRDQYPREINADRLIRQAETHSDQFVMSLERMRDRGFLERVFGGGERLGGLTARAHDLEREMNAIREASYREGNFYEIRSRVANALSVAEDINRTMHYRRLNFEVERQWSMLRSDLNRLARAYNLRQLS